MPDDRFIADGRERLMKSKEYQAAQAEVIAAVGARYAAACGWDLAVAAEVAELAPPGALYLRSAR